MNAVLWWKEYRQQRWVWGTMLALTVFLVVSTVAALGRGAFLQGLEQQDVRDALRTMALCLALAYGVVCGALLLAGEKEDGTQFFLDRLSPKRGPVWQAKLAVGATLTLGLAVTLLAFGLALGFMHWHWLIRLPLFSLDALAWGLLGGAIYRKVLPAVLAGTFFLALAWIVPQVAGSWTAFIAVKAALALTGGWLSWKRYTAEDATRQASSVVRPTNRIAAWRVMVWTMFRHGRWVMLGCLAGCALAAIFIGHAPLIVGPAVTWLIGIGCGLAVFAADQGGGQAFCGNQRLPAGRLWLWKVLPWALTATGFTILLWIETAIILEFHADSRQSVSGVDWLKEWRDQWILAIGPGMFLCVWVLYGFAFGLLIGQIVRRPVLSAISALALGGAYMLAWTPSIFGGGLSVWVVLPAPAVLLAASRLNMRSWMKGRLATARTLAGLACLAVFITGWLTWSLWRRATEIVDLGSPFDLTAYRASFPEGANNEAGRLINEAANQLIVHQKYAAYQLGPPAPITAEQKRLSAQPGERLSFDDLILGVIDEGWPKNDAQISRYLDLLFAGEWARKIDRAATLPLGVVFDPRQAHYSSILGEVPQCRSMASLYAARNRQWQARGDHDRALNKLGTTLALSRQVANKSIPMCYLIGVNVESPALRAWPAWLDNVGSRPELLRAALKVLTTHASAKPPVSDALKGEFLIFMNTLDNPWKHVFRVQPTMEQTAVLALRRAPWEESRETRLIHFAFDKMFAQLSEPAWKTTDDWDWRYWLIEQRSPLLKMLLPAVVHPLRRAHARSGRDLNATILLTALVLYQAEHSRPAAKLEDLAPRYLKAIPEDPATGKPFQYRVSKGEEIEGLPLPSGQESKRIKLVSGQGLLWSEAPESYDQTRRKQFYFHAVPARK